MKRTLIAVQVATRTHACMDRYGSQTMMKEDKDAVHRARGATPSISCTSCQAEPEKNTTARVFSGSHSSLEMVGASAMRDRWPPADMATSYTARPQAVATRRPWVSYTGVMATLLSENLPWSR